MALRDVLIRLGRCCSLKAQGCDGYNWRWFAILLLVAFVVLAARRPEAVLQPQFFAEDATIFFKHAYELSCADSLFKPQASYQNFLVRLFAEASTLFPLRFQPLVFNMVSLLFAVVALTWIALPYFRGLIADDRWRLCLAFFFLLLPNQDSLMKLCYLQWYALFWLCLCAVMPAPRRMDRAVLLLVAAAAIFFTAGIGFILLPPLVVRFLAAEERGERFFAGGMLGAGVLSFIVNLLVVAFEPNHAAQSFEGTWLDVVSGIGKGFVYKDIVSPIIGAGAARRLLDVNHAYAIITLLGLVICAGLAGAAWRVRKSISPVWWCFGYLAVASTLCFLVRPAYAAAMNQKALGALFNERYFFIAGFLFFAFVFAVATQLLAQTSRTAWRRAFLGVGLLACLLLQAMEFRIWRGTNRDFQWPKAAADIEAAERRVAKERVTEHIRFLVNPANPEPWEVVLTIAPKNRGVEKEK